MNTITYTRIDVATFNIHGANGKESEITLLASEVHIRGICETWLQANNTQEAVKFSESACVTQSHNGWRGHGGVAIIVNPLIHYTVVAKVAKTEYQFILIKTRDTHFACVYITPKVSKPQFIECLTILSKYTGRKSVIMGDLNTLHRKWDRISNARGNILVNWFRSGGWKIHAPTEPTFSAHSGSSTVELILTHGMKSHDTQVLHGMWDGFSDHFVVSAKITSNPAYQMVIRSIPQKPRLKPEYIQNDQKLYQDKFPTLSDTIKSCRDTCELEQTYGEFKQYTLEPWTSARKGTPKHFKGFWSCHLDYVKKVRSKLCRKATRTGSSEIWLEYKKISKHLKRVVRNSKRNRLSVMRNCLTLHILEME